MSATAPTPTPTPTPPTTLPALVMWEARITAYTASTPGVSSKDLTKADLVQRAEALLNQSGYVQWKVETVDLQPAWTVGELVKTIRNKKSEYGRVCSLGKGFGVCFADTVTIPLDPATTERV